MVAGGGPVDAAHDGEREEAVHVPARDAGGSGRGKAARATQPPAAAAPWAATASRLPTIAALRLWTAVQTA